MWTCPWTGWTGVGLPGLGGTANLAPADDILISVERPLAIDSMAPMVASILSQKKACGSTHLLIDIPCGPSAKVRSMKEAMQLRNLYEFVGDRIGLITEVIITDGREPLYRLHARFTAEFNVAKQLAKDKLG